MLSGPGRKGPAAALFARLALAVALGACSFAATACGASEEPPGDFAPLFQTAHFDYHIGPDASLPCHSAEEWLERYYAVFSSYMGVALEPGARIEYRLVGSASALAEHGCDVGMLGGCAWGTSILTTTPVSGHEIVHAVASLLGRPPRLFTEGLARILGRTVRLGNQ